MQYMKKCLKVFDPITVLMCICIHCFYAQTFHYKNVVNFYQPEEEYLRENVARIRDIELLTGLRLLSKFNEETSARPRTHLTTALWPTQNIAYKWSDLPCDAKSQNTCPGYHSVLHIIYLELLKKYFISKIDKIRLISL